MTVSQLAESLLDVGYSYQAEIPYLGFAADLDIAVYVVAQAQRIAERIPESDPRLAAFTPFTDATGYVWFPNSGRDGPVHAVLAQATREHWSFERWFTAIAEALTGITEHPSAEDLAGLAERGEVSDQMHEQGYQVSSIGDGGVIWTRP